MMDDYEIASEGDIWCTKCNPEKFNPNENE